MKREIKFRAFQDSQMLSTPISSNYGLNRFFGLLYEDAPVMQFTGLLDTNGKEIYEGDIVTQRASSGTYIIVCDSYEFLLQRIEHEQYVHTNGKDGFKSFQDACGQKSKIWLPKTLKILGNIFENPELLK